MKIFEKTPYFEDGKGYEPNIEPFLLEGKNNPCIIVCPGGGYEILAEHERFNELFNSMGLSVFVLNYRLKPYHYPCQILDVQRAVKFVKYHADEFGINPEKVLIAGSSAGGHLALSACCFADEGNAKGDEIDKLSSKVAGGILCYPVVSLTEFTHQGSSDNFSGGDDKIREKFSIQKSVHKDMPPLFVWHTLTDDAVDVNNVLSLASSCHEKGVKMELHIFPDGPHGMGVPDWHPYVARWTSLCKEWLKYNKFIEN